MRWWKKNNYLKAADTLQKLVNRYHKVHHIRFGEPADFALEQALGLYRSFIGWDYPVKYQPRIQPAPVDLHLRCFILPSRLLRVKLS